MGRVSSSIRSFDPRSIGSIGSGYWTPPYLSIDGDGGIFIADREHDTVGLLNPRWTAVEILFNSDQHAIKSPKAFRYIRETRHLIVAQTRLGGPKYDVLVFNLCSSSDHRTFKSELDLIKSGSFDNVELETCDSSDPSHRMPGKVLYYCPLIISIPWPCLSIWEVLTFWTSPLVRSRVA